MRLTLESCSNISIGPLQKNISRLAKQECPDAINAEIYKHVEQKLKEFTLNGQVFEYTSIPNRLGGFRWFFKCPKCGGRSSKLFLPPSVYNLPQKYLCKHCHKLKNQSALMGQNRIYSKVLRPMKRMKAIEKRIERGYLSPGKIKKLLDEYEVLENCLKSTPEYRLYTFKKRHDIKVH